MSKPTKRVRVRVTIDYQMTEARAEVVHNVLEDVVLALHRSAYPHEFVSPAKGDFVSIDFSEPEPVKTKL